MDANDRDTGRVHQGFDPSRRQRQPAFNVPTIVLLAIAALVLVHVLRTQVLSEAADLQALLDFSFVAGCYEGPIDFCALRAAGADLWTPVTHAFLHGDWTHLAANSLWLLAFGAPVARRIGPSRVVVFAGLGAAAGAGLFYALNPHLFAPMIGASGVVSAVTGGASRFALARLGRLSAQDVAHAPRLTILQSLTNRTVVLFVGVFFATNLLIGSGIGSVLGADLQIAWEAHIGGFLFGFLAFALFDRPPVRRFTH